MPAETGALLWSFEQVSADDDRKGMDRFLAREVPIALEFNGIGYAVLMATPTDLPDLAHGFALSERLATVADDILDVDAFENDRGVILRVALKPECSDRLLQRVRHRVSDSSCGLCGVENLEQALRPLPAITATTGAGPADVFRALSNLDHAQPLNTQTGAVHAAALCGADGTIRLVREDVGRHNAFDKLIGAMARGGLGWDGGFALLSSRCSFELVEKAVLADCPLLATISAPTDLAVRMAREAGLRLAVLARSDAMLLNGCADVPAPRAVA